MVNKNDYTIELRLTVKVLIFYHLLVNKVVY